MVGEIVAIIVLLIVIVYQGLIIWKQREQFSIIEKDLLNRVMTKDYETFVQAEVVKEREKRPLTPEEIYEQQERGIPI